MCSHEGGSAHAGELVLQGCGEQRAARSSAISSYSRSLSQGGYGCNGYECMNTARGSTLDARCCMLLAGALVNGLIGYALDVVSSCIMGSSNEKSRELPNSRRLYFSHIYHAYLLHDHFTIGTHLHSSSALGRSGCAGSVITMGGGDGGGGAATTTASPLPCSSARTARSATPHSAASLGAPSWRVGMGCSAFASILASLRDG